MYLKTKHSQQSLTREHTYDVPDYQLHDHLHLMSSERCERLPNHTSLPPPPPPRASTASLIVGCTKIFGINILNVATTAKQRKERRNGLVNLPPVPTTYKIKWKSKRDALVTAKEKHQCSTRNTRLKAKQDARVNG